MERSLARSEIPITMDCLFDGDSLNLLSSFVKGVTAFAEADLVFKSNGVLVNRLLCCATVDNGLLQFSQ